MMLEISYRNGIPPVLVAIASRLRDLSPAHQRAAEYLLAVHEERYESETDVSGNPLAPLAPSTLARKQALGRRLKILQDTGVTRSRTTAIATRTGAKLSYPAYPPTYHQQGLGVPVRRLYGLNKKNKREISQIYRQFLFSR